ncbi:MAG: hypothetical protein M1829_000417 [Trizodia sp. TS-e1964]|nr:MAG: hypothetical protein M1829_000417 [Trizodia sp. TS-e1964]
MRETPESFSNYKETIARHQKNYPISWTMELELHRQTVLDEWKEYYLYQHRKRPSLDQQFKRLVEKANQKPGGQNAGPVKLPPNRLLNGLAQEPSGSEDKTLHGKQEPESPHPRPVRLIPERDSTPRLRDFMTSKVVVKFDLDKLDDRLNSIMQQIETIGTKCTSSDREDQNHQDIRRGWKSYFTKMRTEHETSQAQLAEYERKKKPHLEMTEWLMSEEVRTGKEFKRLSSWIEREFPEFVLTNSASRQIGPPESGLKPEPATEQESQPESEPEPEPLPPPEISSAKQSKTLWSEKPIFAKAASDQQAPTLKTQLPTAKKTAHPEGNAPSDLPATLRATRSHQASKAASTMIRGRQKASRPSNAPRRSARIKEWQEKLHQLELALYSAPAQLAAASGRKKTRRLSRALSPGTPQGISKTRRYKGKLRQ